MICQSGTSVHKTAHICRMGSAPLRKALYVAAWSAKRYNPPCKELYERLVARGKAPQTGPGSRYQQTPQAGLCRG